MATKTKFQTFSEDWNKTAKWAQENHIPKSTLTPVFNYDVTRLKHGNPMSEAERYRAVLSAYKGNTPTATPGDIPHPEQVLSNVKRTIGNIVTGMNPEGLAVNFYDTIKNTIMHPETTLGALVTEKKAKAEVAHPTHSILEFVPGALDALKVATAKNPLTGLETLANHPVSSLLDVFTYGKLADFGARAAGIDASKIAARRLGIPEEVTSRDSFWRNIGKIGLSADSPFKGRMYLTKTDDGAAVYGNGTIADTINDWAVRHHVGKPAQHLMKGALTINQKMTDQAINLLKPLDESMQNLTTDERADVVDALEKSGKSYTELRNTQHLTVTQKAVISAYEPLEQWMQANAISSGALTQVRMPTGKMEVYSNRIGAIVQRASDKAKAALVAFESRKDDLKAVHARSTQTEAQAQSILSDLSTLRNTLWQYITQTIPTDNEDLANQLRSALPEESRNSEPPAIRKDRINRLTHTEDSRFDNPQMKRMLGVGPSEPVYVRGTKELLKSHTNILTDVFKPDGLIDKISEAFAHYNYDAARKLTLNAYKRLTGKYAMEINVKANPQLLDNIRSHVSQLYELAKTRNAEEREYTKIETGKHLKGKPVHVMTLRDNYIKLQRAFMDAVQKHPPEKYQPIYLDILTRRLIEHEGTSKVTSAFKKELIAKGYSEEQVRGLGNNPRILIELMTRFSDSVYNDPLIGKVFPGIIAQVQASALKELSELRERGLTVHYVPHITAHQLSDEGTYNVFIKTDRVPTIQSARARTFNYGQSVNNFMAAVTHAVRDQLAHDGTQEFLTKHVIPQWTYRYGDIENLVNTIPKFQERLSDINNRDSRGAILTSIYKDMGLVDWDPNRLFSTQLVKPLMNDEAHLLIPEGIAETLSKIIERDQLPMEGALDKLTNLFRFSILGLSPRFTLHIAVGGTYLLALKTNPLIFRYLPEAYNMVKNNTMPDQVLHSITQEGNEHVVFHYRGGRDGGRSAIQEKLISWGIPIHLAKLPTYIKAGADLNFRFTRYVGNMQRALAFFDGASKVGPINFIRDENGVVHMNPSKEEALTEGFKAVDRVMGDVRAMAPIERQWATKVMPFYGWTKHIIKYVLTLPVDHPFRTQILANMAEANNANVPNGLATRIQLLFFLGTPDQFGNVTALTDRFADPLRTMGNYASLSGYLSALNPVLLAPLTYIDPSIVYGTNTLYPTMSYTQLYGVEQANPSGSLITSASQFVPQLSSLAEVFKLTRTYRQMAKNDPAAFKKSILESLNVPFFNVQHLNLKQMEARTEVERYGIAETKARTAEYTGTFTLIKGYPTVPYPTQSVYNITPEKLEEMYNASMKETGLPPQDMAKYIQPPPLL